MATHLIWQTPFYGIVAGCLVVNLGRHLGLDPEAALRRTNAKFTRRFEAVEAQLSERGRTPATSDLAEMDALWDAVKAAEKAAR